MAKLVTSEFRKNLVINMLLLHETSTYPELFSNLNDEITT